MGIPSEIKGPVTDGSIVNQFQGTFEMDDKKGKASPEEQNWEPITDALTRKLPEFIGTLGVAQTSTISMKTKDSSNQPNWKDTSWNEKRVIETKHEKVQPALEDIRILDVKMIPPDFKTTANDGPTINRFQGSLMKKLQGASINVRTEEVKITSVKTAGRKGRLEKEYSVLTEPEDAEEEERLKLKHLNEYSVVSEPDEADEKTGKESRTKKLSVLSLEKNEGVNSLKMETQIADHDVEPQAAELQEAAAGEEPKTYSRKKKKAKNGQAGGNEQAGENAQAGVNAQPGVKAQTGVNAQAGVNALAGVNSQVGDFSTPASLDESSVRTVINDESPEETEQ